jgi:hypothetical protein
MTKMPGDAAAALARLLASQQYRNRGSLWL